MKIKICLKNLGIIQAELTKINGTAKAHTYDADDVLRLSDTFERRLLKLVGTKKHLPGASAFACSGDSVSNAYVNKNYSPRIGTTVACVRGSSAWYLTDVQRSGIRQNGGYETLILTPEQDSLAVMLLRTQYAHGGYYWIGSGGTVIPWGVFTDEQAAQAAFKLVSGQITA